MSVEQLRRQKMSTENWKRMGLSNCGAGSPSFYRTKVDRMFLRLNCTELPVVAKVGELSQRKPIRILLTVTNWLYDGWIYAFLLIFLLVRKDWRLLLVTAMGVVIAFIFYWMMKPWLARVRPCNFSTMRTIQARCLDRYSFPSGHCMTLTVVGIFVSWRYQTVFPVLLGMLLLLCWARMAAAHHYPSDLIAGIGIGLFVAIPLAMILL
jgi:undecaprenyl-diphosphatase